MPRNGAEMLKLPKGEPLCQSQVQTKEKNSFGHPPSADESDSEELSGRIIVGKLESHSISAKIYIDSPFPSNNP